MTREWPNHANPWHEWRRAASGGRMHHAWMLAGKEGLGKREFANAAARELVAQSGVTQPSDHPDIITLSNLPKDDKEQKKRDEGKPYLKKRNIAVDQVREMQKRLTTRPTLGERRAIIINPADDMETSASNALLKSLEEPPQGTYFLLVTHRPARLLPTIRSRCRILRFGSLNEAQLAQMLEAEGYTADALAMNAAGGSFGAALRFAELELGSVARVIEGLLTLGDPTMAGRGELSRLIGGRADRVRIQAVLDLAQTLVAQHARTASDAYRRSALIEAHTKLIALEAEAPTYNFDTGLLSLEIGSLLVSASASSEPAHG